MGGEGRHRILVFSNEPEIVSRTILLATGANYQHIGIPGLEALLGAALDMGKELPRLKQWKDNTCSLRVQVTP